MPKRLELAPLAYRNDRRRGISTAVVLGIISLIALPLWLRQSPAGQKTVPVVYAVVMTTAAA
jgi:uncharacterized membrane protein